jgi:hypothetical protein
MSVVELNIAVCEEDVKIFLKRFLREISLPALDRKRAIADSAPN